MLEQASSNHRRALARRSEWEPLWRECYTHALPQRSPGARPGGSASTRLYDGTAADCADQLAASLLAELMPPWSQWFGLRPGDAVPMEHRGALAEHLEGVAERVHGHLNRSNFAVEMHQCLLDLATIGTATLMFSEAPPGAPSAFDFHAVPMDELALDGDHNGRIRAQYRRTKLNLASLRRAFNDAALPPTLIEAGRAEPDQTFEVIEAVEAEGEGCTYAAWLGDLAEPERSKFQLAKGRFRQSPFLTFRWLKSAGEIYGRSPVMTALADIRTANKVVELVLTNAALAVSGIWLVDDDGVINTANLQLTPGALIPKAAGSAGLTPVRPAGNFDVSELVLNDLRTRIRHTMLVDRLGPVSDARMTATEVMERSTETARLLGAVFGRLQAELMTPLIGRALAILARRGEVAPLSLDGHSVELDYRSPLARAQAREDVRNTLLWLETTQKLGPDATAVADLQATALWLARTLGVPSQLVRNDLAGPPTGGRDR